MVSDLKGKRILFFSPAFFSYEQIISEKMRSMGASVEYYDERAVKSALERAVLKFCPSVFNRKAEKYYSRIIEEQKGKSFDYILIIKGDMVSKKTLRKLREAFPMAKLCLHLWDSMENIPHIGEKLGLFDYATSFDRNDCLDNPKLVLRPLFYAKEFETEKRETDKDIVFCGTIHSDRYAIIKCVRKWCEENNRRFYIFQYLQSKFIYYFYKLTKSSFKDTKLNDFSYEKKPLSEISEIEASGKAILDIQHPKQTGLTMRTIEMIGMGKKLITTNADIVNYDLYNPANVCVIDRNNPVIDGTFLDKDFVPVDESVRARYSLERWIMDVLGEM